MTPDQVVAILRRARFRIGTEAALQASIAEALDDAGAAFAAEVRLAPGERIDFMVDRGIGIEAKVKCDKRAIYRQLTNGAHFVGMPVGTIVGRTNRYRVENRRFLLIPDGGRTRART